MAFILNISKEYLSKSNATLPTFINIGQKYLIYFCTKISIFSAISIQLHCKLMKKWDITRTLFWADNLTLGKVGWVAQKLHFFSWILAKSAQNRRFWAIFTKNTVKNGTYTDLISDPFFTGVYIQPQVVMSSHHVDLHFNLFSKRGVHKSCKKLHFFWHFFRKIDENRRNWALLGHFMAQIWEIYGSSH